MKRLLAVLFCLLSAIVRAEDKEPIYLVEMRIINLPATAVTEAELLAADARGVERLLAHKQADVLSAPKIATYAERVATVQIQQEIAYLRPTNSLYAIEHVTAGLEAKVKVTPTGADSVLANVGVELVTMTGRMKSPDPKCDMGEPILSRQRVETTVAARLGVNTLLGTSKTRTAAGKEEYLLVVARVTREAK